MKNRMDILTTNTISLPLALPPVFVNNFEHPEDKVASQMDKEIQARARTYRKLLKWWHRLSLIVAANA